MNHSDYYNEKGYPVPTEYQAMKNWEKEERKAGRNPNYRPLVFICSAYSGTQVQVERNITATRKYCKTAVERGFLPIAPHLFFPQFLNDSSSEEHSLGINLGKILMTKCQEIWVFGTPVEKLIVYDTNAPERLIGVRKHPPILLDVNRKYPVATSHDMDEEIRFAKKKKIPVRFFDKNGKEVFKK